MTVARQGGDAEVKMSKPTKSDCDGCENNFYNGNNPLGVRECWSFKDTKMVSKIAIHINLPPPYLHIKPKSRPDCYRMSRHVLVKPENLTKEGYWK